MEPPSPVSIDRSTVSPTTRPTPASRMHRWPAVADLTSCRPIRIALFQVGAAPKASAHFEFSQQISQRSDPFLYSFNRAARRWRGWDFLVRRQVSHALRKTLPSRKRYVLLGCLSSIQIRITSIPSNVKRTMINAPQKVKKILSNSISAP